MEVLSYAALTPAPLDEERMHALCRRLPPFPPLAAQLIKLFSSEDASLQDAAVLIRSDAIFSGELLRLANSAEFANYETFDDVGRAVLYLGFDRVQRAIRRITYGRLMNDAFSHAFTADIHRSNIATAYLCECLMKKFGDVAMYGQFCPYTLGLYLKIGALVLLRGYPRDYPRFLGLPARGEADMLASERALFGFNHIEISCHLAEYWGFPAELQTLIGEHAEPPALDVPATLGEIARLAWRMAGSLGYTFLKPLRYEPFDALVSTVSRDPGDGFSRHAADWQVRIDTHLAELSPMP